MIGRIIDTRDPDTYISYDVYEECIRLARIATEENRARLEKMANDKLSPIGISMELSVRENTLGRVFMTISSIKDGEKEIMHICQISDGDDMEKDTKMCIKKLFDEYIEK